METLLEKESCCKDFYPIILKHFSFRINIKDL